MEGSREQVGTDHDRVEAVFVLKGDRAKRVQAGGPRIVHCKLPAVSAVTQATLETLSQQCAKPANLGPKFRASAATKTLGEMARHSNRPDDWKTYLSTLRKEKQQWKGERIERASADWKLYKSLTKSKQAWGDEYMARAEGMDPVEDIEVHFRNVFHDQGVGDVAAQLERVVAGVVEGKSMTPFTEAEVAKAIMQGRSGRAVGPDMVPVEVLKSMAECSSSLAALKDFFTGILLTGEVPLQWDRSVATLIPKLTAPTEAKHLRPITLASHVAKSFARLLLLRMEPLLRPTGPKQFACKGRQPAEVAWLATYVTHLSREWNRDCYMLKLDLARAFDTTHRVRLAEKTKTWTGEDLPFETRCMVRMLASSDVILSLPWKDVPINANTGVKQGATESPILFSRLIDEVLTSIQLQHDGEVVEGLGSDGSAYMDDVITWKGDIGSVQRFVDMLLPRLAVFGLKVNPSKSRLLVLRGSRRVSLKLGEEEIHRAQPPYPPREHRSLRL